MADPILEKLEEFEKFRVDAYCEGYPDVIFEIILNNEPTPEQTEIAVNALTEFFDNYNKRHFFNRKYGRSRRM